MNRGVIVYVDQREMSLWQQLNRAVDTFRAEYLEGVRLLLTPLPLGDIWLSYTTAELMTVRRGEADALLEDPHETPKQVHAPSVVVERKTWEDFSKSLIDGRWAEQSYRLYHSALVPPHRVYYLLEKQPPQNMSDERKRGLLTSRSQAELVHGFHCLYADTVTDSALQLLILARVLRDQVDADASTTNPMRYARVASASVEKATNMTPANAQAVMLTVIPGVGASAAEAIMRHFLSLEALIAALRASGPAALDGLTMSTDLVKSRKLPRNLGPVLVKYLVGDVLEASVAASSVAAAPSVDALPLPTHEPKKRKRS